MDNAASSPVSRIPIQERKGSKVLENLFFDYPQERSKLGIPDCYTTNPQAEVLLFGAIEPEYITRIAVESLDLNLPTDILVEQDNSLFNGRQDYYYWGKLNNG